MIYFIQDEAVNLIKIGFTDGPTEDRLRALQTGSASPLRLLCSMPGDLALEHELHQRFAAARVQGEWFRPTPELLGFLLRGARESGVDEGFRNAVASLAHRVTASFLAENTWVRGEAIADRQLGRSFLVLCPVCGFDCNHLINPEPHTLPVNGDTRVISFAGECGHRWSLAFGFHKGNCFLASVRDRDREENETAFCAADGFTA